MKDAFLEDLRRIVGPRHVLTGGRATRRYATGFRCGGGPVAAVVRPGSLVEMWRVLNTVVASGRVVILQAANTGLTGGSTPWGEAYDREVVLISVMRLNRVHLLAHGAQVLCLPGATLDQLEKTLRPLGREPHSVIGSSCIGASVIGGVCNNSGGALIQRGPAYTELSLYAEVRADGSLALVNHLGLDLGPTPEAMLARLDAGEIPAVTLGAGSQGKGGHGEGRQGAGGQEAWASDHDYCTHVRQVDADTPARFNADPRRLNGASGCGGKLAVFAVRLDSFPAEKSSTVFYIGTNDPGELTRIRRDILSGFEALPIAAEYIHRDAYDIAARYGKDTFVFLQKLGTDRIPQLFAAKARVDSWVERLGLRPGFSDRWLQRLSRLLPQHLPMRMQEYRDRYSHHLLLRMGGAGVEEARRYLQGLLPSTSGAMFECTPPEAKAAFLHRFAVAGAAVRYRQVHPEAVEDILALDVALPRNTRDWTEALPAEIEGQLLGKLYYGHFFCHVFHQDYIVRKGADPIALEHEMWHILDSRGAEYPAEHNVGHLYKAKPALAAHYRQLDPTNTLNPGLGQTSFQAGYAESEA